MRGMRTWVALSVGLMAVGAVLGCSANSTDDSEFSSATGGSGGTLGPGVGGGGAGGSLLGPDGGGTGGGGDDCSDNAKKIFVVSEQGGLYTFDPTIQGLAAYVQLGTLNCNSASTPQTMGVDRSGNAWVFYSAGQLYKVSTSAGAVTCTPTSYQHPGSGGPYTLGMGFTAAAPSSKDQVFYMLSESFGLASIDVANTFGVSMTNALGGVSGELTGGPDGRLFTYEAGNGRLSEILVASGFGQQPLTTLGQIAGASAWAFSRYAGVFYIFTGDALFSGSQCSMYDESNGSFMVRDADVGFTVVGAGQSTCVPPPVPK